MIQLLFTVIFSEMALIMVLLFKTPLRKLVIMGLDRVKRGRGPIMVRTVAGTVLVVLISSVYSMMKIQKRGIDDGVVNPTDQVLMAKHLLEASLMGNSTFFLVIRLILILIFFLLFWFCLNFVELLNKLLSFFFWICR